MIISFCCNNSHFIVSILLGDSVLAILLRGILTYFEFQAT